MNRHKLYLARYADSPATLTRHAMQDHASSLPEVCGPLTHGTVRLTFEHSQWLASTTYRAGDTEIVPLALLG